MASNERDPDGAVGPARGKRRAQDHARAFSDDWVTPSAPPPKKTAVPPPPVPVPAPSGVYDTVESAWLAGSSVPVPPAPPTPKASFPVPEGVTAAETSRIALAVPGGVPAPAGDRVDLLASQFPHLVEGEYLVRKVERGNKPGQLVVHWHDHAACTVMSRGKAVDLLGQEVLDRHLAGPRPGAAPFSQPSDWEKLVLGSLREVVSRDLALLDTTGGCWCRTRRSSPTAPSPAPLSA